MVSMRSTVGGDIAVYGGASVGSLTLLDCVAYSATHPAVLWEADSTTTYRIRITAIDDNVLVRAEEAGVRGQFVVADSRLAGDRLVVVPLVRRVVAPGHAQAGQLMATDAELRRRRQRGRPPQERLDEVRLVTEHPNDVERIAPESSTGELHPRPRLPLQLLHPPRLERLSHRAALGVRPPLQFADETAESGGSRRRVGRAARRPAPESTP